jgi:ATP-dependent RNA helicase DeaD
MTDNSEAQGTFAELNLHPLVQKGVDKAGFITPTDIQSEMIPAILGGDDVIGQAKTGTGKTAAFGLPILHMADKDTPMQALILTPTRELAAQITAELDELGQFTPIRTTCVIGGESMRQQQKSIERGGHILIATPGRVMDLHGRGQIHFNNIRFVVLDEVDRMLDIGFREDIRKILKGVTGKHQTVFVSATIDQNIERLARTFMSPQTKRITTISGSLTVARVTQTYLSVERWDKRTLLLYLLRHEKPDTTLIFCKTKATVHKVTQYLRDKGITALEIHGDLHQSKRNRVMQSMRDGKLDVLVASDLAARGLDVEHITHVINYDLPEDPEIYVHRIGRTARAGRQGLAWSFVTPDQGQMLTDIEKLAGIHIEQFDCPGYKPGPIPSDIRDERDREDGRRTARKDPASRIEPKPVAEIAPDDLAAMFPDGVIPKSAPRKTIGSRFRSRRG